MNENLIKILDLLYDLDVFTEGTGPARTFTVRVWNEGEAIIEVTRKDLAAALRMARIYAEARAEADRDVADLVARGHL